MTTRDLTAAHFQQTISANSNVLVYFWAPLCAPCDLLTPTYEASSRKHFDVVHGKVNIETEKDLASIAGVKLLPTLMAFKKGKLVFKQAGIANPAIMDNLVQQLRAYTFKSPAGEGIGPGTKTSS
ncbi:thioredoxin family protein [Mycobacterium canetti]|uniref:thioredoxin family protein n=1 Tax=Mycobacterium canetti TaxID=78331 RepID=UPI0002A5A060|nr:thioredoxin family protein [Mycobacterium canetti]CCK63612.1 Thioredoxin TrxA [Mycobacterium canettii CIPT 140070017]